MSRKTVYLREDEIRNSPASDGYLRKQESVATGLMVV